MLKDIIITTATITFLTSFMVYIVLTFRNTFKK